jgi:hypothetical protein
MDSTRISLARVLELGVQMSWREAAAIVQEAVALTGPTKGARPDSLGPDACFITRGGDVVLAGSAAKARPETVVLLLEQLLPACDSPGGLGAAFERGTVLAFLEDLSLRTTAKRRRVEIASVAIRGIAAESDRAMQAEGLETAALPPLTESVSARHEDAPRQPATPAPMPAMVERATATAIAAAPAIVRPSTHAAPPHLRVVPPSAPIDEAIVEATAAFGRLRDDVRQEVRRPGLDLQAILNRLRTLDWRKGAAAAAPIVLFTAWYLWPSPGLRLPPRPTENDPVAAAAIPLLPGWADVDRLGQRVRAAAGPARSPAAPVRPPTTNIGAPPAMVAEPPSDAAIALVAPNSAIPSGAPGPGRAVAPTTVTTSPSAPIAPAPAAPPAAAAETAAADVDTVYSWSSAGVEPPVIRSPAMPSWATPPPGAAIDGPYLEVLVDPQGQVETVRIRGRLDPGETFYRHRMMLASAKLWQFAPARLNGRPVRYVTRVVIEQP